MTDTKLLVGSLSNDLLRVANSVQRGSDASASRFLQEAVRWATPLQALPVAEYIRNIAQTVSSAPLNHIPLSQAERYLMYGVLLQNYSLHIK